MRLSRPCLHLPSAEADAGKLKSQDGPYSLGNLVLFGSYALATHLRLLPKDSFPVSPNQGLTTFSIVWTTYLGSEEAMESIDRFGMFQVPGFRGAVGKKAFSLSLSWQVASENRNPDSHAPSPNPTLQECSPIPKPPAGKRNLCILHTKLSSDPTLHEPQLLLCCLSAADRHDCMLSASASTAACPTSTKCSLFVVAALKFMYEGFSLPLR